MNKARIKGLIKRNSPCQITVTSEEPIIFDFVKDTFYEVVTKPFKKNRSLDQNALLWSLVNDIDKVSNGGRSSDPIEVYQSLLIQASVRTAKVFLRKDVTVQMYKDIKNNLSEFSAMKIIRENFKHEGETYDEVILYYGSSLYDTKEMGMLIEKALDWASELDINTEYVRGLLSEVDNL